MSRTSELLRAADSKRCAVRGRKERRTARSPGCQVGMIVEGSIDVGDLLCSRYGYRGCRTRTNAPRTRRYLVASEQNRWNRAMDYLMDDLSGTPREANASEQN